MASVGSGARVRVPRMFTHDHCSPNSQTLAVADGRDEVVQKLQDEKKRRGRARGDRKGVGRGDVGGRMQYARKRHLHKDGESEARKLEEA